MRSLETRTGVGRRGILKKILHSPKSRRDEPSGWRSVRTLTKCNAGRGSLIAREFFFVPFSFLKNSTPSRLHVVALPCPAPEDASTASAATSSSPCFVFRVSLEEGYASAARDEEQTANYSYHPPNSPHDHLS